jgi:hypothetical protein
LIEKQKSLNMKKWLIRKRKALRQYIVMRRLWLLKKLFTEDEKYLLIRAIEDRIDNLERIAVNERWADKYNITIDVADYSKLKKIFSTRDWG